MIHLTCDPGDVVTVTNDKYQCKHCGKELQRNPSDLKPFVMGHALCFYNAIMSKKDKLEIVVKFYGNGGLIIPDQILRREMR